MNFFRFLARSLSEFRKKRPSRDFLISASIIFVTLLFGMILLLLTDFFRNHIFNLKIFAYSILSLHVLICIRQRYRFPVGFWAGVILSSILF